MLNMFIGSLVGPAKYLCGPYAAQYYVCPNCKQVNRKKMLVAVVIVVLASAVCSTVGKQRTYYR